MDLRITESLDDKPLTRIISKLYLDIENNTKGFVEDLSNQVIWDGYPVELRAFIESVYSEFKHVPFCYSGEYHIEQYGLEKESNDKEVLVAFSSGKDSLAVVIELMNRGYKPVLFYESKINRSYRAEGQKCEILANKLGLELVVFDGITYSGKSNYKESPIKNMMILSSMIDYGRLRGIKNYSMGLTTSKHKSSGRFELNWSDIYELKQDFDVFVSSMYPWYNPIQILEARSQPYKIIVNSPYADLIKDVQSCILPDYRRERIMRLNREKYGIEPLGDRCGSCHKCAIDYLYLTGLGYYKSNNKAFYRHLFEVLRDKTGVVLGDNYKMPKTASVQEVLSAWGFSLGDFK